MTATINSKKDWLDISFGELFDIKKGSGLSKDKLFPGGKYSCILYGELYTRYGEVIRDVFNRTDIFEGVPSEYGDLLIPASTTTSGIDLAIATSLKQNNVMLGGDINILRRKHGAPEYNSDFMAYYLTHMKKYEIAKVAQGTTIVHLYAKDLKDIQLLLPPLNIQEQIVNIIEVTNKAIVVTQKIINEAEQLKKALLQQLVRVEGVTSELGRKIKKISDGIHATPKYTDLSDYYFINGNNLSDGRITFFNTTKMIDKGEYLKYEKELDENTVLLSINGTIGNLAVYRNEKIILGKSAAYIQCCDSNMRDFIYYYLQTAAAKSFFDGELTGTTIRNLSLGSIRKLPVPVILTPVHKKIIQILQSIDNQIEINKKLKAKQEQLKCGLMKDLLTGKVAV